MSVRVRFASICAVPLIMGSCASLNFVHDPQFGIVDRALLPALLKSIRCELITFYEANRRRQKHFDAYMKNNDPKFTIAKINPELALAEFSHFKLDEKLYGMFFLDLKVVDTLNVPASGTSIDRKYIQDSTHSKTWHFGPTASDVNTYQFQWLFAVRQDSKLATTPIQGPMGFAPEQFDDGDNFRCYSEIGTDLDGLARGDYRKFQQFRRIYVNGITPLAAWLQDNSQTMATVLLSATESDSEAIFPAQMFYSFMVQVSGGIDVKFTLLSPQWSPLAPNVFGSVQQTSNLQFYINGDKTAAASGAKSGSAKYDQPPTPPTHVIVDKTVKVITDDKKQMFIVPETLEDEPKTDKEKKAKQKKIAPIAPSVPRSMDRSPGYLTYPIPITPPGPTQ